MCHKSALLVPIRGDLPVCCGSAHILPLVLKLMVELDFLIYGPCHAPFISMATEGHGGEVGKMISEADSGV